ncbi:MAG: trigger factor [Chloroflexota bacterium]
MKVTQDKIERSQAYLTIEMDAAELEKGMERAYRRLVNRLNIPGFRKGKAPREIVERFVGRESLLEDALGILIPEAYEHAVEEQKLEAFAQPGLELTQKEPPILKAVVPLKPTVKLGNYNALRMSPEAVKLTDEDTERAIEQLRHQHATWEPVERVIQAGDLVGIDVASTVDGQDYLTRKNARYQVVSGFPLPAPGFAEALIGMKRDEEKEFKLKFPEDYPRPELAQKEASFKVKILEVKQEKLPEMNDDFAKQVNPEYKNLAELKEKVAEELKHQLEESAKIEFENKVIEAVVAQAQLEYPPSLIESEIESLKQARMRELQMDEQGLQEYLRNVKKTEPELREELRPRAVRRITGSLVLARVAEAEKLTVTEDDLKGEIERLVSSAETDKKEEFRKSLETGQARQSIEDMLLTRKVVGRLVEIANPPSDKKVEEKKQ